MVAPADDWIAFSVISGVGELLGHSEKRLLLEGAAARLVLEKAEVVVLPDTDIRVVGCRTKRDAPDIGQALGRYWYIANG